MNSAQRRKVKRINQKQELVNLIACRLKGHDIITMNMNRWPEYICHTCALAKRMKRGHIDTASIYKNILRKYK